MCDGHLPFQVGACMLEERWLSLYIEYKLLTYALSKAAKAWTAQPKQAP